PTSTSSLVLRTLILRYTPSSLSFFFFTTTPPPDIYTLSLHDALPICRTDLLDVHRLADVVDRTRPDRLHRRVDRAEGRHDDGLRDRKSTRLNSSHDQISYAVFCLKKKKNNKKQTIMTYLCNHRHTSVT